MSESEPKQATVPADDLAAAVAKAMSAALEKAGLRQVVGVSRPDQRAVSARRDIGFHRRVLGEFMYMEARMGRAVPDEAAVNLLNALERAAGEAE